MRGSRKSLTRDGTMDGLQDNGASNLRGVKPDGTNTDTEMGSPFGGDGGDAMADPVDGCKQVQEYTNLSMTVTEDCDTNPGALSEAAATSYKTDPGDPGARFIAPLDVDRSEPKSWIAAGQYAWTQRKGYAIRSGSQWTDTFDLGAGHGATAVAMDKGVGYVACWGPCNKHRLHPRAAWPPTPRAPGRR